MDGIGKARKSLEKQGFNPYYGDVNIIDPSRLERADVLLSSGAREVWVKERSTRGRPSTGFDKRAYMKEYMRKRRASKAKALPKTPQTINMTPII